MAAADVGHLGTAFELLLHTLERRDPLRHEVRAVAGPEEPLGAAEQPVVVLVPAHSLTTAERLEDAILVGIQRRDRVIHAEDVERAVFVGERKRLLVGQRVTVAVGVVAHVAAGRLVPEPLADVALSRTGALCDFLRSQRPGMRHRFVQAEFLADHHERSADDRSHVGDRLPHKGLELGLVDLRGTH